MNSVIIDKISYQTFIILIKQGKNVEIISSNADDLSFLVKSFVNLFNLN